LIWYSPIRWRGFLTGSFFNLIQLNPEIKKKYEGEIGSSDFDDPFTQEEKIGKGGKPKPSERRRQEELQRERDYSGELEQYGERYIDKYQDFPTFYG
jgi:hypothetical protein